MALLLAAIDMEQVIQAAELLGRESAAGDRGNANFHQLLRSLETAIATGYVRGLRGKKKQSWRVEKDETKPDDANLLSIHEYLVRVRNKTYAHTDRKEAQRTASARWEEGPNGEPVVVYGESWVPWIAAHHVPDIVALATHQRERFRAMALRFPPLDESSIPELQEPAGTN